MIYLDIETLDFFQDPHIKALPRSEQLKAIRFGIAVTYDSDTDEWKEWRSEYARLLHGYLRGKAVAGWNIRSFDLPIIASNADHEFNENALQYAAFDLFDEIRRTTGRWYKLDVVADANLGRQKLSHGQQATEWLRSGHEQDIAKAFEYCREDVQLVVDLHQHLLDGNPLFLPKRPERKELNDIAWWLDKDPDWIVGEDGVLGTK